MKLPRWLKSLLCGCFPGGIVTDGSLLELADMINDVTGKDAVLEYSLYGCYCGWGGKGRPKDQTDWCCQRHDCCYGQLDDQGCETKIEEYTYTYRSGKVTCCKSAGAWCQRQTCECDKKFVQCLKKHLKTYQHAYNFYLKDSCSGLNPQCQS
uniref:Phospholipase A2 n=1 Tax=Varanus komodoensis TaxID=61221 RepID=A0A8D2KXA4_VARKO